MNSLFRLRALVLCLAALFLFFGLTPATAQDDEFRINWIPGPTTVDLAGNVAQLYVPSGYLFTGAEDTQALMEYMGNPTDGTEVGTLVPKADDKDWLLVFEYREVGYVSDEDKDKIDADKILKSFKEGTEESNKYREERGIPALHIIGWYEKPHYDVISHNLVWAILAQDEGDESQVVNYNTRILGRKGYMSAVLVTEPGLLDQDKGEVETILGSFEYKEGQRYAEFKEGDKVAKYGLTALIAGGAGVAAAKFGLFKVLAKFGKFIILGIVAVLAGLRNKIMGLFRKE